jgi:hypothetical protein
MPEHRVRRPALRSELAAEAGVVRITPCIGRFPARDQAHDGREPVGVDHHPLPGWVESESAPVHAAGVPRVHEGTALARRREHTVGAQPRELFATPRTIGVRCAPDLVGGQSLRHERRGTGRERLRRRRPFARHIARRHMTLLDRKHRLAGIAVQSRDVLARDVAQLRVLGGVIARIRRPLDIGRRRVDHPRDRGGTRRDGEQLSKRHVSGSI